MEAILQQEFSE